MESYFTMLHNYLRAENIALPVPARVKEKEQPDKHLCVM